MSDIEMVYTGNLSVRCIHTETEAEIITDAPKDNHGRGEMFSPTDLVAVSLGSCVLTLVGIMAQKLKVEVGGMKARVHKEMATKPVRRIGKIVVHVECPQSFSDEVRVKLEEAGRGCPVHHSLHPDILQEFHFIWGKA
jgi:uncharacterized OsmC-like protein